MIDPEYEGRVSAARRTDRDPFCVRNARVGGRCACTADHLDACSAGMCARPMKIAMVSDAHDMRVVEQAAAQVRSGHHVTVYLRQADAESSDPCLTPQGYTMMPVPAGPATPLPEGELFEYAEPFAQFLDAHWTADRPDAVHGHFGMSGFAAQLAARHLNLPTVQTFSPARETEPAVDTRRGRLRDRRHLEALVARSASWVTASCTEDVSRLVRLGVPRGRVCVVPFGVDLQLFNPDGPVAPRGDMHRIVTVGRFAPRNGFDTIIRALPHIAGAELLIIGEPDSADAESDSEAGKLIQLATNLDVAQRLRIIASVPREALPAILRSADVAVCTSQSDGGLEAMACGVPVVASWSGPMLDAIVHDVTGYLIDATRPAELPKALNRLLRDDFLRQSMGASGCDRARARFSWEQVASDYERVYSRLQQVRASA
ncbi:glycosyltransferase [Mycolicibacterium celeriflavum]|uniref:glycosyltransferase n=1 Tax=Mycolicibacterium celeriflavum TaxID=1249101 RepID=UPI003CF1651F